MYENYSRHAMPSQEYRQLLGTTLTVFNSNNSFIIENILRNDDESKYNWYQLIDRVSGKLKYPIKETITKASNDEIATLFDEIISKRNRIIHSFQITNKDGEQMLQTKDSDNNQFEITKEYLMEFIKDNEKLRLDLHALRGY